MLKGGGRQSGYLCERMFMCLNTKNISWTKGCHAEVDGWVGFKPPPAEGSAPAPLTQLPLLSRLFLSGAFDRITLAMLLTV